MDTDTYFSDEAPRDTKRDLAGVLDRLTGARAPDRELDAAIHTALTGAHCWNEPLDGWVAQFGDTAGWETLPAYTSSVDDALALKTRVLPGQACALGDMAFELTQHEPWATIWTT